MAARQPSHHARRRVAADTSRSASPPSVPPPLPPAEDESDDNFFSFLFGSNKNEAAADAVAEHTKEDQLMAGVQLLALLFDAEHEAPVNGTTGEVQLDGFHENSVHDDDDQVVDEDAFAVDEDTFKRYIVKYHQDDVAGQKELMSAFWSTAAESGEPDMASIGQLRAFLSAADIKLLRIYAATGKKDVIAPPDATHQLLQHILGTAMCLAFLVVLCVACFATRGEFWRVGFFKQMLDDPPTTVPTVSRQNTGRAGLPPSAEPSSPPKDAACDPFAGVVRPLQNSISEVPESSQSPPRVRARAWLPSRSSQGPTRNPPGITRSASSACMSATSRPPPVARAASIDETDGSVLPPSTPVRRSQSTVWSHDEERKKHKLAFLERQMASRGSESAGLEDVGRGSATLQGPASAPGACASAALRPTPRAVMPPHIKPTKRKPSLTKSASLQDIANVSMQDIANFLMP
uniref:Uncharacterized protein n=1 Tax=Coccolithus braarudii TaxID=221442 RepID=A0A7S0L7I7_9EUKA